MFRYVLPVNGLYHRNATSNLPRGGFEFLCITPASVLCFDRNDQENCVRNSPVIHGTVDEAKKKKAARLAAQKARIVITNIIVGRTNDQTTQLASIHRQGIDGCRARCTHGYFYDQRGPGNAGKLS